MRGVGGELAGGSGAFAVCLSPSVLWAWCIKLFLCLRVLSEGEPGFVWELCWCFCGMEAVIERLIGFHVGGKGCFGF